MQKITSPLIFEFPDDKLRKIFLTVDPGVACGLAAWRFECTLRNIITSVNPNAFSSQSNRIGQDLEKRAAFYENQWKQVIQFYLLNSQPLDDDKTRKIQEKYSLKSILPHFTSTNQSEDFLIHLFHIRDFQLHGRKPYPQKNHTQENSINQNPYDFIPYHYLACRDFELILAGTQILKSFIFRINQENNKNSTIGNLLSQKNLSMNEKDVIQQILNLIDEIINLPENPSPSQSLQAAELFFLFSDIFFEKHITRALEQFNSKGAFPTHTIINKIHGINPYKKLCNKAEKHPSICKNTHYTRLIDFVPNNKQEDFLTLMQSTVNQLRHCGEYRLPKLKNKRWNSPEFLPLKPTEQAQEILTDLGKTLIETIIKKAKELDQKNSSVSIIRGRISRKGSYKN